MFVKFFKAKLIFAPYAASGFAVIFSASSAYSQRQNLAFGEAPEYYKVEPGDNLYDICDELLDDPSYWPKLWSINPGIKNPHFIFPGMTLSFYPGDDALPPELKIVAQEEIAPIEGMMFSEDDLVALEATAASFDSNDSQFGTVNEQSLFYDSEQLKMNEAAMVAYEPEIIGEVSSGSSKSLQKPAFIFEDEPESFGTIGSGLIGEIQNKVGDVVQVEINEDNTPPPGVYSIVRETGSIYSSAGDFVGIRYEFVAHATLEASSNSLIATAKVIESRLGTRPNDLLIAFRRTKYSFSASSSSATSSSTPNAPNDFSKFVVGLEYPTKGIGVRGDAVFLSSGFSPGSFVRVYRNNKIRSESLFEEVAVDQDSIGIAMVLESDSNSSFGVLFESSSDIRLGDIVQ